jgi:transposase-like protein
MDSPETLQQAIEFFADPANCHAFMVALRWPDGIVSCPTCGRPNPAWLANVQRFQCGAKHPKRQFSVKVGTIFEDSPIALKSWLLAVWMIVNCKNGISSYEIARALGVTQKTGWFMLHRIRKAMQDSDGGQLGGEIEIDETYIGGKARNMHHDKREKMRGRTWQGKAAVMGLLQRHPSKGKSRVRTAVIPSTKRHQLKHQIEKHVEDGATVYTDSLPSYDYLPVYYNHNVINHAEAYAEGQVHTNGLENFWSLLKRSIRGTYVSVEPFHLFRYLDEQAMRFNERGLTDAERFAKTMKQIHGRRVTFDELTASNEEEARA